MLDAAADVAAGVEVQREIGPRVTAIGPTIDFGAIGAKCGGYGFFGGGAIGPGGGSGDVAFVAETLAKFVVGAADVFLQGVGTAIFVAG